jgi:hypothetical protein
MTSPDVSQAREKLFAARAATQGQHMTEAAERLALESRRGAELASTRIEASKTKAVNDEMRCGTETLSQEMQRIAGGKY